MCKDIKAKNEIGKVSVIMGIYNCQDTLPAAIESIVNQTYENWELIMCDDGSIDDTYEVAAQFQEQYPDKIVLVRNKRNMRLAYTLNHCLEMATGEYIARMDADDESYPERFEKQVEYLQSHKNVDLVGSAYQFFNDEGPTSVVTAPQYPDKYTLRRINPFSHATIMAHKYVFDRLGGYTVSERTTRSQDKELFFRFYKEGFYGENIQDVLYYGRDGMDAVKRRTFKVRWNSFLIKKDGFRLLGYPRWWIIRPFVETIIKSLVPYGVIYKYRGKQKNLNYNK